MARTDLYFVRHGETDYNLNRIVQGRRINSVLNATGQAQARALAHRLADIPFDAVYTSTLQRAEQTAAAILEQQGDVPFFCLRDLEEMSWGIYEGEPSSERIRQAFEQMAAVWRQGRFDQRIEGGESIQDVQTRALRAMDTILEQYRGGTVLVVTHGRLLRVLLASLLPAYGLRRMHEIHHANTAVNHLVHDGGGYASRLLNCTAHLEEVELIMVE